MVRLRDLEIGDMGWILQQHGLRYAQDDGFDKTFEVLVAEILVDFYQNHNPATERGWLAEENGQRLGCIFCTRPSQEAAKLRLFLVVPEARGKGVGRKLLEACLNFAGATGAKHLNLWTHESHEAACALYARFGFVCVASKPVCSFGQELVEQTWKITFPREMSCK